MVNGALHMFLNACDFAFEESDPLLELGHRQRIEVLFDQERDRVAGARKILFGIHGRCSRGWRAVSMRAEPGIPRDHQLSRFDALALSPCRSEASFVRFGGEGPSTTLGPLRQQFGTLLNITEIASDADKIR